jgi:sorting nexin-8
MFATPTPAYRQSTAPVPRSPAPNYSADDPWNTARFNAVTGSDGARGSLTNGAPSSLSGTGLPRDWWKKQETVNVSILGQQGFFLNRYTIYEIGSEVSF